MLASASLLNDASPENLGGYPEGATEQTATWDVSAVLSTVADAAGDDLLGQILLQLPAGYDLLFGCPQRYGPQAATTLP